MAKTKSAKNMEVEATKVEAAKTKKPTVGKADTKEITVEEKLRALYNLQKIDSQIDKIRIIRGELPLEVQDLEDEIAGLETRIQKYTDESASLDQMIEDKKRFKVEADAAIKKYESQLNTVRNNREYDSLTKEIEYQRLEIQLADKRIIEYADSKEAKLQVIEDSKALIEDKKGDLAAKQKELDDIVAENEKEEEILQEQSEKNEGIIEERLIIAYKKIRKNMRNGLAVVPIERSSCGGCFNKIPPQRQMEIRLRKKIVVCEYCGRILIDAEMAAE